MENNSSVHEYKSNAEKRSDFILGFAGWFLISVIFLFSCFGIMLAFFTIGQEGTGHEEGVFFLPLVINGFILFWLFSRRRWIGWGMLSSILLNALITILVTYQQTGFFSTTSPIGGFALGPVGMLGMMNIPFWLYYFIG